MKKNSLKIAICTIIKDEELYLREWIAHHLNINGVERIFIYEDYESVSHKKICEEFGDKVLLNRLFDIKYIYDTPKYKDKQTPLYNYFIQKYKNDYDFVLFTDIDEFLYFKEGYSLSDILEPCLTNNQTGMVIPWKMYGANGLVSRDNTKSVVETFTKECDFLENDLMRLKSIVNLKYKDVEMCNCHWIPNGNIKNIENDGKDAIIWLNHYFTKSWDEWCDRFLYRGDILPGTRKINDFFECNKDMISQKEALMQRYYNRKYVTNIPNIILSVATHDRRLNTCLPCLESLTKQTVKPYKTIVNIKNSDYEKMPIKFKTFCNENDIEIYNCPLDLKPHNKYYWSMTRFRDCIVITVDDDYVYSPTMIEELIESYRKYPKCVSARFTALLINDNQGKLVKYDDWGHLYIGINTPSSQLIAYGCNGVLYPPDCLKLTENDIESIKECIGADDIWLKYREIENNIKTVMAEGYKNDKSMFIKNGIIHKSALFNENIAGGMNDEYLKKFPLNVRDENDKHQEKLTHARQCLNVMKLLGKERK